MDFKVNTVHFTADGKLVDFIHEKVKKLELMYDNIIASEVYLRLDKSEGYENKIAEVKILLPGNELFAKKQLDYGISNISTGANLETKEGKDFALNGLWFRMNDKISRWKNLIIKNRKGNNETLLDTYQDLGNYSIICQLINKGLWKE